MLGAAAPFLDTRGIFGPPILPLTPWSHLLLSRHANPFFSGRLPTVAAVLQFLWFNSPELWAIRHHPDGTPRRNHSPRRAAFRYWLFRLRWRLVVTRTVRFSNGVYSRGPSMRVIRAIRTHIAEAIAEPLPKPARKVGDAVIAAEDSTAHELITNELMAQRLIGASGPDFWHRPYAHTRQLLAVALEVRAQDPHKPKFNRAQDKKIGERLRRRKAEIQARFSRN